MGPQVPGEGARVDARDGRDPIVAKEGRELPGTIEDGGSGIGHDERPQPRPEGLVVVEQTTVVADERVGHDHDLAGIGRVRADLLVAGLAGVDDQVATRRHGGTERDAGEDGPILEGQQRGPQVADSRIDDGRGSRRRRDDHAVRAGSRNGPAGRDAPWARAWRIHPPIGRGTVDQPPSRPLWTGTPASLDRP